MVDELCASTPILIVFFDAEAGADVILKTLRTSDHFSDSFVISDTAHAPGELAIGLLAFRDPVLRHGAILRFSRESSTGKQLIKFIRVRPFPPVDLAKFSQHLTDFQAYHVRSSEGRLNGMPPMVQEELKRTLGPQEREVLAELETLRAQLQAEFSQREFREAAAEKDVIMLLTRVASFDPNIAPMWKPPQAGDGNAPRTYVDQLARNHEYQLVSKDLYLLNNLFPGWAREEQARGFHLIDPKKDERLIVVDAGGDDVEHELGVDVYFYNYKFNSYVLVQYKALEPNGDHRPLFRRNKQIEIEFERMRSIRERLNAHRALISSKPQSYRLCPEPFFVRFVERFSAKPNSIDMLKGFFVPADLCEQVLASQHKIASDDRHISNTDFVELLRHGWIGTVDQDSYFIKAVIDAAEKSNLPHKNKAMAVALVKNEPGKPALPVARSRRAAR